MLTSLAILFWISVILFLLSLVLVADDACREVGQIIFFVGLAGMFMFGMAYILRADVEDRKEFVRQCSEACGGQYIDHNDACFCIKGYAVKPEKESK